MQRNSHLDAQFERVFGVQVEAYWLGPVCGFDLTRFDGEVLDSGHRTVQQALEDRVTQARRSGVPFRVDAAELILYVRYLCTGTFDYRHLDPLRTRLHAALRGEPCPA